MPDPKFQKRVEDFTCEKCGEQVRGNGYTNHCPHCLWSKHVDVHPGDRAESCCGMMEPKAIEGASPEYTIQHRCTRCSMERRNTVDATDDRTAVIGIAQNKAMEDTDIV